MIDLAERCHANIVALNEHHRARVAAIMARCQTELDRAREDYLAELAEIEINATIAMDKRLEGFRGGGTGAGEGSGSEASPAEEPKPVIAISAPAPKATPRLAELLNDEGAHKPLPRVLERPVRDAS